MMTITIGDKEYEIRRDFGTVTYIAMAGGGQIIVVHHNDIGERRFSSVHDFTHYLLWNGYIIPTKETADMDTSDRAYAHAQARRIIGLLGIDYCKSHKIQVIKKIRESVLGHNLGLKESKDAYEAVMDVEHSGPIKRTHADVTTHIAQIDRTINALHEMRTLLVDEQAKLNEPEHDIITWASWDADLNAYRPYIAVKESAQTWSVNGKAGHYTWDELKTAFPVLADGYYPMEMKPFEYTTPVAPF